MVDQHAPDLDTVFKALADPTRRAMLQRLADEDLSVSALAEPLDMSLAAASKHIQVLERAGLVRRTVQGRTHTCRLDAGPLHAGVEWLRHYERFWTGRVDALERLVRAAHASPQSSPRPSPKPSPKRRKP